MKRIKILFLLEATIGGAYTHVMLLIKNLPKDQYDISLILSPIRNPLQCEKDVMELRAAGVSCEFIPMQRNISLINDAMSFVRIYRYFTKKSFSIVHVHSSKAGIMGRIIVPLHKL